MFVARLFSGADSGHVEYPVVDQNHATQNAVAKRAIMSYNVPENLKLCRLVTDLIHLLPYHSTAKARKQLATFADLQHYHKKSWCAPLQSTACQCLPPATQRAVCLPRVHLASPAVPVVAATIWRATLP